MIPFQFDLGTLYLPLHSGDIKSREISHSVPNWILRVSKGLCSALGLSVGPQLGLLRFDIELKFYIFYEICRIWWPTRLFIVHAIHPNNTLGMKKVLEEIQKVTTIE